MIRYNLAKQNHWPVTNVYGLWSQDVDFITNHIDIVVINTQYNTHESTYIESELAKLDITKYDIFESGTISQTTQYFCVRFYDKEDIVKIRICMQEIEHQHTHPYNLPKYETKEYHA